MAKSYEQIKIENLERYHKNKEKYNERQKAYFRNIWYIKNRRAVILYQKQKREENNIKRYNIEDQPNIIINKNVTIYF